MSTNTVLITGANRGIGLELVKTYFKAGNWDTIACCRVPTQAGELTKLADASDGKIRVHRLEVTDKRSVANLSAAIQGRQLDVLINNAGIMGGSHTAAFEMDDEQWIDVFKVNCMAPLRISQTLLDNLRLSKSPKIITISSQMGAFALPGGGAYAYRASKAAVNKVMHTLAQDLAEENIIVALIHPGWVRTDMGGKVADISVQESANGIYRLVTALTLNDSGRFFKWTGEPHPW